MNKQIDNHFLNAPPWNSLGIPQANSLKIQMPDRESLHTWKGFTKTSGKCLSFYRWLGFRRQVGWRLWGHGWRCVLKGRKGFYVFFWRKFEFFSTCILCFILDEDLMSFNNRLWCCFLSRRRIWCYPESLSTPHWLALAGQFPKKTFSQLLITLIIPTHRRSRSGAQSFQIALMEMEMVDDDGLYRNVLGCTGLYWVVLGWTGLYWSVVGWAGGQMAQVVRMISFDDMHSENIWFSWSKSPNYWEKTKYDFHFYFVNRNETHF